MTGGNTWVQCSLQILLYFVADRHSGAGERLLYPKLQADTFGYSGADRSLYTSSLNDIRVYTLGDRLWAGDDGLNVITSNQGNKNGTL